MSESPKREDQDHEDIEQREQLEDLEVGDEERDRVSGGGTVGGTTRTGDREIV